MEEANNSYENDWVSVKGSCKSEVMIKVSAKRKKEFTEYRTFDGIVFFSSHVSSLGRPWVSKRKILAFPEEKSSDFRVRLYTWDRIGEGILDMGRYYYDSSSSDGRLRMVLENARTEAAHGCFEDGRKKWIAEIEDAVLTEIDRRQGIVDVPVKAMKENAETLDEEVRELTGKSESGTRERLTGFFWEILRRVGLSRELK